MTQTALVVDLIRPATGDVGAAVRQLVFSRSSADGNRFIALARQLSPTATAKHWKRWPVEGSSLDPGSESWLSEYLVMHRERSFRVASIFTVEVTDAEWDEMAERDSTPRSLMVRVDRARDSLGGNTFTPEPRFADISVAVDTVGEIQGAMAAWRAGGTDAPAVAPTGRARSARVPAAANPIAAPVAEQAAGVGVAPGERVVLPDGTVYVAREIASGLSDVDFLRRGRAEGVYALLYSVPGTGKTRATQAAFGSDLVEMLGTDDTEVTDFVGNYVPTGRPGEYRWVDGPLVVAMDEGRPLLVDEIALIDPRTLSILYSAMDGRREINVTMNPKRGRVRAVDGFYVVGAYNPGAPGARISEALVSRFALQVEYSTDYDIMESLGVPRTFILAAKNLETKRRNDEISVAPQSRECLAFMRTAEMFGEDVALRNVVSGTPEQDRGVVADVLSRSYGRRVGSLATAG